MAGVRSAAASRYCGLAGSPAAGRCRKEADEQARHGGQQADEERRHGQVEAGMEVGGEAAGIAVEPCQQGADLVEERQRERGADDACREVADGQPELHRIAAGPFQDRIDRAADIGAEHHGERGLRPDQARGGERDHRQHDHDARMRRPGQAGGDHDVEQRLARQRGEQVAHRRRMLARADRLGEQMQRQKHQPEPDRNATEILEARAAAAPEGEDADRDQHREDQRDVEGEHLHDQRGADIGAEHDGKGRDELDGAGTGEGHRHQGGCGRGLQQRGDAEPGQEGAEAGAQSAAEEAPQVGAEDPRHAALHHVDAPQQQRDLADDVDQQVRGGHAAPSGFRRFVTNLS